MAEKVFFKIVIPNYNNMAYIRECLDSILNQTFQDFKIIVVDDLSDDMSYEFAKMYERKHPSKIVVLRAPEKKYAGGCRNIGIDYPIDCEYYYFLDSDDYLASNRSLETMHAGIQSRPDILLFSFYQTINGREIHHDSRKFRFNANSDAFMSSAWNSSSSKIVKSSKIEYFLEGCMRAEDTVQWLKLLDKYPTVKQIYDEIFVYRRHTGSTTMSPLFAKHRKILIDALKKLRLEMKNPHVINSINRRLNGGKDKI